VPSISATGAAFEHRDEPSCRGQTPRGVFVHDRGTERVSVDSSGTEGDAASGAPSISADGRYVAFESDATNLVAGDANTATDVFVHDRLTGTTERASVDGGGTGGNAASSAASISGDGQRVSFTSFATNLVAGDTNGFSDVFVRDFAATTTVRASVSNGGAETTRLQRRDLRGWQRRRVRERRVDLSRGHESENGRVRATGAATTDRATSRPAECRGTPRASISRSRATVATSRSTPTRRTSSPGTRTGSRTSSCATARAPRRSA
jgi:hypothetical protein